MFETASTSSRPIRNLILGPVVALLVFTPSLIVRAQTRTAPPPAAFPDLIGGLKKTIGCLGVETAQTSSGKQVIFAWFEDKKAALNWYYSDTHLASMRVIGAQPSSHPMAGVPETGTPVLAIASITLKGGQDANTPMTISQIAIELYTPLAGGLASGGRFAPATLKVPGLQEAPMAEPKN